jgi:hypothetical protein
VWSLWRRRRLESWLLSGPLLLTIAAAAVRQYPFADRLILFLVPTLFLWAGEGAGWLGALLARAVTPYLRRLPTRSDIERAPSRRAYRRHHS